MKGRSKNLLIIAGIALGGGLGVSLLYRAFGNPKSIEDVFFGLAFGLLVLLIAGIAGFWRYSSGPLEDLTLSVLGSRKKLKKAPPLLSQVEKLLQERQPREALQLAEEYYREYPELPELPFLIARIQIEHLGEPEAGLAVLAGRFDRPDFRQYQDNLPMLFYYADICERLDRPEDAAELLELELERHRNTYPATEQRHIRQRLESLGAIR